MLRATFGLCTRFMTTQSANCLTPLQGIRQSFSAGPPTGKFKLLFCGKEFPAAYQLTKEELRANTDVQVCFCDRSEVADEIKNAHAIVPLMTKIDKKMLEQAQALQFIIQYGVGLEGVDSHQALSQGIHVANIPSHGTGNAMSCAEHALYLTLALLRNQNGMAQSIQDRKLGEPLGSMLAGKNVMIIGYGGIATQLIPLLKPFRVRMIGLRKRDWSHGGTFNQQSREVSKMLAMKINWDDFPQQAGKMDIIILTCTQTKETFKMVNHNFLDRCRPGVMIVNVARGGLLDYDAVKAGLDDGQIGGLGLDVQWSEPIDPNDPIAKHPKVILTPHVAGVTETSYRNMAKIVAEQIRRLAAGRMLSQDISCLKPKIRSAI